MWLTLLITLLSFVLTKMSGGNDKKALGTAALAGAGTYLATTQTDWGKDMSASFDKFIGVAPKADPVKKENIDVTTGFDTDGSPVTVKKPVAVVEGSRGGGSAGLGSILGGLWSGLGSMGQAVVSGVAAWSLKDYIPWIVGGLALLFLLK